MTNLLVFQPLVGHSLGRDESALLRSPAACSGLPNGGGTGEKMLVELHVK
jgi:hypothetical protein